MKSLSRITQLEESRRNFLIKLLGTGLISSNMMLVSACGVSSKESIAALGTGQSIFKMGGDIKINSKTASLKTLIFAGDTITTGDKSYIIFVLGGESFILRSNTSMILENINPAKQNLTGITLKTGKMLSVFAPKKTFNITTPQAIVSIRGTGVYLEAEASQSYICTCYGETKISAARQPGINEIITATHHDAPRYIVQDGSDTRIIPAPFINHDDEELLLIETLVGRETPYIVPGGTGRSRKRYF